MRRGELLFGSHALRKAWLRTLSAAQGGRPRRHVGRAAPLAGGQLEGGSFFSRGDAAFFFFICVPERLILLPFAASPTSFRRSVGVCVSGTRRVPEVGAGQSGAECRVDWLTEGASRLLQAAGVRGVRAYQSALAENYVDRRT